MTDKELRKLNRAELLEMLISVSKENENLKKALSDTEEKLNSREILINEAGSIAEASLILNGVFEDAQKACGQYIENINRTNSERENILAQAKAEAESIISDARNTAQKIINEAKQETDNDEKNMSED